MPHLPREVFPEYYLVRVNVYDKIPETPFDEWLTYLKTGKVKENTRTPGLQEVKKKLQYLSMTPSERKSYEAHMETIRFQNDVLDTAREEGWEEGREKGLEEGRAEGRAEGIISVAKNMIAQGLDDNMISALTGLSVPEVEAIRKDAGMQGDL